MNKKFKQDQGVAGLTILLSLIVMLFVIGLLVMIFSIMGSKLRTSTYDTTTGVVNNETVTTLNETVGDYLSKYDLRDVACSITRVENKTDGTLVSAGNYTVTNCLLKGVLTAEYINQNVNVTYSYTYEADNEATDVMNDTVSSVATSVEWFDIFVVIGAMVVLILLTVIIITSIRSSGLVNETSTASPNRVGSA